MDSKKAKTLLSQGRAVYADLTNGQRHRIIHVGFKYCRSISGRDIDLSSVLNFN